MPLGAPKHQGCARLRICRRTTSSLSRAEGLPKVVPDSVVCPSQPLNAGDPRGAVFKSAALWFCRSPERCSRLSKTSFQTLKHVSSARLETQHQTDAEVIRSLEPRVHSPDTSSKADGDCFELARRCSKTIRRCSPQNAGCVLVDPCGKSRFV